MREFSLNLCFTCWGLAAAAALAQAQVQAAPPSRAAGESLRGFLRTLDDDKTTRYLAAFVDLNGDGMLEAVVYLTGNAWCGSGGCNTLILTPDRDSWRVVSRITITRPPIRVLTNVSNGWRNIGVRVQGGGIQPGYEVQLRYDGRTYPENPSTSPAQRLTVKTPGDILIPSSQGGILLYSAALSQETGQITATLSGSQGPRPSFDCAKARTPTERLICGDAELASMDSGMATAYLEVLKKLPSDQKAKMRHEQSDWFIQYARTCNPILSDEARKECVARYLSARTADLRSRLR